jgi:hypothetical protein
MKKIFLILFCLLYSNAVADVYQAKSFKCNYYYVAIGEIKNNKYKIDTSKEDKMGFSYVNIDLINGSAQMVGNGGTANVTAISAQPSGVHFVEMTSAGNLTMTTIYPQEIGYNSLGQKLFSSSHSRHMAMINNSLPQQYYGQCALME